MTKNTIDWQYTERGQLSCQLLLILVQVIWLVAGTPLTNMAQSFSFKENASSFGIISSCFLRNQKENDA